jgi:hypothetical protein
MKDSEVLSRAQLLLQYLLALDTNPKTNHPSNAPPASRRFIPVSELKDA